MGKLFILISAYKPAVSTLLILTLSIFKVGSMLDFVYSGFLYSRFCLILNFFRSELCPILDFFHSGFCPFRMLSVLDFV